MVKKVMQIIRVDKPGRREVTVEVGKGEEKRVRVVVDSEKSEVRGEKDYKIKIRVVHKEKGGKARVEFRGVASGGVRLKVAGLIKIYPGAQEVESFLDMRGLILDDKSAVEIDPQLEIEANDVRASHAASVGPVDDKMLAFLGSMGIEKGEGEKMVVEGFLS